MTLIMPNFGDGGFASDLRQAVLKNKHLDDVTKDRFKKTLSDSMQSNINLLFIGHEDVGLQTTISAIFKEIDKPQLREEQHSRHSGTISRFGLTGMSLWCCEISGNDFNDHQKRFQVRSLLEETDQNGAPLIDLVIPVFNASRLQPENGIQLLNDWILPSLGRNPEHRLLMLANHTDRLNESLSQLGSLHNMVQDGELNMDVLSASLRYQLIERFGIDTRPLFCATEPEVGGPFNLIKILTAMVSKLSAEKRPQLLNQLLARGLSAFAFNDGKHVYQHQIENAIFDSFFPGQKNGGRVGDRLGSNLDINGQVAGRLIQSGVNRILGLSHGAL
ncbi:hypothetical protein [Veronia pacifica]|uniref:Uncharacterized protein n=2 Tax=Veronia pacifica TaxID=1080227 RepID=A0A1C3EPI2_9GAMM|nr:hypothetical protein A8L45_05550 [Veronia pacifica]